MNWRKRAGAVFALCAMTAIALTAQTFTTLYSFDGTDGQHPDAGLVQATNGDFYGTTANGGTNCAPGGCGTVFKITPSGTLTTLYSFCASEGCFDGENPTAGLVQGTDGNFYGTTSAGGESNGGTVFKMTPSGTLTTLHSFCASPDGCLDGENPEGLVQGTDGSFYGTTFSRGASNGGTVFKITPSGTLTTLYSFCSQSGCPDGQYPEAGLVQGTDGNFYGPTAGGGANVGTNGAPGAGTVFKITPSGTLTTLYSFCASEVCTDGQYPVAGLVQGTDGNFYGTTAGGGANVGINYGTGGGTVFKITPSGTLTTLYSFCSYGGIYCTDGALPDAGLVQATNGDFYGTTANGNHGVIVRGGTNCPPPAVARFSKSPQVAR
jgi:uncharacterized repeat protein (TIGR03803 family)